MVEKLRLEDFSGRVGESFRLVLPDGGKVDIELIEATDLGGKPFTRPPFSIVFRLPEEHARQQQIQRIEHDELGVMELFLVPIGPGKEGMQCEAVFT